MYQISAERDWRRGYLVALDEQFNQPMGKYSFLGQNHSLVAFKGIDYRSLLYPLRNHRRLCKAIGGELAVGRGSELLSVSSE